MRDSLRTSVRRDCLGISRRHALHIGASGMLAGLTLPRLMAMDSQAATNVVAQAKACIFLFLEGGPPHQDMWDPKPEAPIEIRGPFQTIPTAVPGTYFTEHCALSAKIADKFTVLRSHSHADNGHSTGYHYLMTGRKAAFADGEHHIPTNDLYPSIGSIVSKELGAKTSIPPYINMPHPMSAGGPGFFGAEHAPFIIESDPQQPDFEVKDLSAIDGIDPSRQLARQRLLAGLEQKLSRAQGRSAVMSTYYEKALELIASVDAKKAFDIHAEPESIRREYGDTQIGQSALLARRLVESGCRFVGVDAPGWDVHFNCFPSLKTDLIPYADRAFSALITDLERRGMLDSTLVVMMGEMGRTPRVNAQAGRDHWSMAQSICFAGGGVKPGQILGATDKQAAYPTTDPVGISDVLKTIFHQLGVDTTKEYLTPLGRPVPIVDGGKLIPNLLA
ncbi:MAG: DUF1501 domain-containing protein [Planctomycetota bacterium]